MTRTTNLVALLAAAAMTALAVAGLSNGASSAVPVPTAKPTISGTAQVGNTLTASTGTWTSSTAITYSYQWRRCDSTGAGCSNIGGADSSTYQVKSSDLGHALRVRVTARNADGSASNESDPTSAVTAKAPPVVNGCPTGSGPIDVAQITPPARLLIDGQSVSPSPITRSVGDVTMRFHVSACGGRSVTGALVYTTAVPFNQFSVPAEVQTGSDGWATMTLHREAGFPAARQQQLLAVFIRARKSGENLLGGISTRLLASFPVNLRS
jgi:hypothetical protein